MYSVNGVPLDNAGLGWIFRAPSKPLSELVKRVQSLYVPGRSGVVTVDSSVDAPVLPLVVQTPNAHLEDLIALFLPGGSLSRTANPARSVDFQYVSASHEGYSDADAYVDVTFTIRLDGAYWRDTNVSQSTAQSLAAGMTTHNVFTGMSAPIEDALIKIIGPAGANAVVFDIASQNSFKFTGSIPAGKALVYDCADETAALMDDPSFWFGGTDVSGQINFGGARFKITPYMPSPTDPTTRMGRIQVNATSISSPTSKVQVQGRGAYVV